MDERGRRRGGRRREQERVGRVAAQAGGFIMRLYVCVARSQSISGHFWLLSINATEVAARRPL